MSRKIIIYHNKVAEASNHDETVEELVITEVLPVEFLKEWEL